MRLGHLENSGQSQIRRPALSSPSDQLLPLRSGEIHIFPGQRCRDPDRITSQLEATPNRPALLLGQTASYTGGVTTFQSSFKANFPDSTG